MPILDRTPSFDLIEQRLQTDIIFWLGTTRPNGRPHLVPVWFHWDGERMLVLSRPITQKVRNLRITPFVTIALDDSRDGKDVVLFEGEATLIEQPASDLKLDDYIDKYRSLLSEMNWPIAEMTADYSQAISIRPSRFIVW